MSEDHPTKRCSKCKQDLPRSEFYSDKRAPDGLYSRCKSCHSTAVTRYATTQAGKQTAQKAKAKFRKSHADEIKGYMSQYRASEEAMAANRIACRQWRKHNKEKTKAENVVNYAIRQGKLPRPDTLKCHKCLRRANHYHHYLGYAPEHWLDVIPLCLSCHSRSHKSLP